VIVLHEPKIIALKARKVGGTSFEIALSNYASPSSIITPITADDERIRQALGYRGPQHYLGSPEKRVAGQPLFYNHMSAAEARTRLGDALWRSYTKIAIMRNPFDQAVSTYFWQVKTAQQRAALGFEAFILANPKRLFFNHAIYKIAGADVIDVMINYDHLRTDIEALEVSHPALLGLANTFSHIAAKGQYRPKNATTERMFEHAPRALELIYKLFENEIHRHRFCVPGMGPGTDR